MELLHKQKSIKGNFEIANGRMAEMCENKDHRPDCGSFTRLSYSRTPPSESQKGLVLFKYSSLGKVGLKSPDFERILGQKTRIGYRILVSNFKDVEVEVSLLENLSNWSKLTDKNVTKQMIRSTILNNGNFGVILISYSIYMQA